MRKSFLLASMLFPLLALADAKPAAPAAEGDDDEEICRTEFNTGSHVRGTVVCKSRAEWAAQAQQAQEALGDIGRQGAVQTRNGN